MKHWKQTHALIHLVNGTRITTGLCYKPWVITADQDYSSNGIRATFEVLQDDSPDEIQPIVDHFEDVFIGQPRRCGRWDPSFPTLHVELPQISEWRKEGNVLFNDTLNTFYLRLYGVRHMVKDHSDCEWGNPLPPHGLLFPISSKGYFIYIIPQTGKCIPRPLLHQSSEWMTDCHVPTTTEGWQHRMSSTVGACHPSIWVLLGKRTIIKRSHHDPSTGRRSSTTSMSDI